MLTVVFVLADGQRMVCAAHAGETVMDVALDNGVPGIGARCGGAGHCTTCHGWIAEPWRPALGPPDAAEDEMLRGLKDRRSSSRLTCQIVLTDTLDGLEVGVP